MNVTYVARHEITQEEMEKFRRDHRATAASSFGPASSKQLEMTLDGDRFIVTDHREVVYDGADLSRAIEVYNAAP
jgi:hypothetical protein